jgi:hypothetical protein
MKSSAQFLLTTAQAPSKENEKVREYLNGIGRGGIHMTKYENWRELVSECSESGKAAKTWCLEHNIP